MTVDRKQNPRPELGPRCERCGFYAGDWDPATREYQIHPTEHRFIPLTRDLLTSPFAHPTGEEAPSP